MNRKCGQNVATDDRRTFTDKDKVRRVQTLGNDNKDAMLDCESGFHQSEDKRKLTLNLHFRVDSLFHHFVINLGLVM